MAAATLEAVKRDTRGKNAARRLRAAGQIPAVVYGGSEAPVAVAVDPKRLSRILHSEAGVNSIIDLKLDGSVTQVLVKEFLLDPIKHSLLHADFYRVQMDKPITVTVPVVVKGDARGVKQQGGFLDLPHREVEIESLPSEIPEAIEVDVTELLIGQTIRLRDVAAGARWTPVSDPDTPLAHVIAPRVEETPGEAAAATSEPEVIKKGKDEKEEK
ncbi:MAG TPA: 50S ribosomal protein L25 [Vicinamibacterales bacterium]